MDAVTLTSPTGFWTAVLKPRVWHFGHRYLGFGLSHLWFWPSTSWLSEIMQVLRHFLIVFSSQPSEVAHCGRYAWLWALSLVYSKLINIKRVQNCTTLFDTARPRVPGNTPAKREVDGMNGSWDTWRTHRQTDWLRVLASFQRIPWISVLPYNLNGCARTESYRCSNRN